MLGLSERDEELQKVLSDGLRVFHKVPHSKHRVFLKVPHMMHQRAISAFADRVSSPYQSPQKGLIKREPHEMHSSVREGIEARSAGVDVELKGPHAADDDDSPDVRPANGDHTRPTLTIAFRLSCISKLVSTFMLC